MTSLDAWQVAPMWFMAQLTFNVSLGLTSVTSNTILSSTSALFTYAAGMALHLEAWEAQRLGAIGLCMAGVCFCDAYLCFQCSHLRHPALELQALQWSPLWTINRGVGLPRTACWAICCACCQPASMPLTLWPSASEM